MLLSTLAQSDLEPWINAIILILVIGGSVFGAVSKKLIAHFSPKKSQDGSAPKPLASGRAADEIPPSRRSRTARPVARSLPPIPDTESIPTLIQPLPPRPAARARPAPHTARPATPASEPGQVRRRRRSVQPHVPPTPTEIEQEVRTLGSGVRAEEARFEAATAKRMSHLDAGFDERASQLDAGVEARLGHVESPTDFPEAITEHRGAGVIGHLSRSSLLRAIVLNEILATPLGLRQFEDRF